MLFFHSILARLTAYDFFSGYLRFSLPKKSGCSSLPTRSVQWRAESALKFMAVFLMLPGGPSALATASSFLGIQDQQDQPGAIQDSSKGFSQELEVPRFSRAPADQAAAEKVVALISSLTPYRNQSPLEGDLKVFGTPTMDAIASRWSEGLSRVCSELNIQLSNVKGKQILQELQNHPDGVAMLAHPLKPEELQQLREQGLKSPRQVEVGVQALGIFVHESNPLTRISQQQFFKIFSSAELNKQGELVIPQISGEQDVCDWTQVTWGDLGVGGLWQEKKIHLACRDEISGTDIFLRERLLGGMPPRVPKVRFSSSAEVLAMIADDPQAVGLSNLRSRQEGVRALQLIDGERVISCDDYAVLTGQYPLVRKITLVFDYDPNNPRTTAAREFVKFALSQEGQRETVLAGFYPVEPEITKAQLHNLELPQE
jgi:phosphate transport system substrate-binding protein